MKELLLKVLSTILVVFVLFGLPLLLAVYANVMWLILSQLCTQMILMFAIYKIVRWIFANEK